MKQLKPKIKNFPSILFANVRSIKNKFDELSNCITNNSCDLNFFVESWLNSEIENVNVQVCGYNTVRLDRKSDKVGGGIICYLRKDFNFCIIPFDNPNNFEIIALYFNSTSHLFIVVYHPYWHENHIHDAAIDTFCEIIHNTQTKYPSHSLSINILGDFNGLMNVMKNFCDTLNLKNCVDFPTRGTSIIDGCFTNTKTTITTTKLSPIGSSDHCTIKIVPSLKFKKQNVSFKFVPDYSPSNKNKFNDLMLQTNFNICQEIHNGVDLNLEYDIFIGKLESIYKISFPMKKIKVQKNDLPWINNSIKICMKKRDNFYKRSNIPLFKHYRNKVKLMIKEAKSRYIKNIEKLSKKTMCVK